MSEEEQNDESLFSALSMISKANPVVLAISFALMNVFVYVFNSEMQFNFKACALALSFFFFVAGLFFEFYRIEKERELKEKGFLCE